MNYQQGDILYVKIDAQYYVSKILRVDEDFGIYHVCSYIPMLQEPVLKDVPELMAFILHAPISDFPDGVILTNEPVKPEELVGYLEYLKLTDFGGYLKETGQDAKEVVAAANELYTKALALTDEKKYEEAIEHYSQAFELFPLFYEAMDNRAFVKMDMGRWQEAIEDFQISLSVNPESVLAEFSIGECYLKMKDYVAAKEQFEKALSIDPNDKLSLEFLAKVQALMK